MGDEGINVRGSFGENKPIPSDDEQKVKHPEGPYVDEMKEEQEGCSSIEITDVGFGSCMHDDQNVHHNENR